MPYSIDVNLQIKKKKQTKRDADYKLGYSELHEIPLPTVLLASQSCNLSF